MASSGSKPTVGILGVGKIGLSLAKRLLAESYPVVGLSLTPLDEFVRLGGVIVNSGADLAERCDVLVEVLGSESAFDAVVFGENGVVKTAKPNQIMIALSSYPLAYKQEQEKKLQAHKMLCVDATVSGSPTKIDEGQAVIFVGGDEAVIERSATLLSAMCPIWHNVGGFGSATKFKFVNNTLSFVHNLAAAEALAFGVKMGLDPHRMVELLQTGTGASASLSFRGPKMADRVYPVTGDLAGAQLVVDSILDMAELVDADMPLMNRSSEYYRRAIDQHNLGDEDVAQLYEMLLGTADSQ